MADALNMSFAEPELDMSFVGDDIDLSGINTAEKLSDPDVVNALPETLKFAIWDTGIEMSLFKSRSS